MNDLTMENIKRAYDKNLIWYTVLQTVDDSSLVSVNNPYTEGGTVSVSMDSSRLRMQGSDYVLEAFYEYLCENPHVIEKI